MEKIEIKNNQIKTHKWVVKSVSYIFDTILIIFLIWFGINNNLFNWQADWWYSLLTFLSVSTSGYIFNWNNKED